MKTLFLFLAACAVSGLLACDFSNPDLAIDFLNSLTKEQRSKAQMPFDHASKSSWHYFPSTMYQRSGIQLNELDADQKNQLFKLLRSFLSESGYNKSMKIIDLENVLAALSGNTEMRDPEKYHAAFYGNPAKDSLWAWSFEGHHLSLNFTVHHQEISAAPRFMGANPATILSGKRKGERTLQREEDLGFDLINSLDKKQQDLAILQEKAFPDIITSNNSKVDPLHPIGIKYEELNLSQRAILLELINEYLSNMPEALATKRMERLKEEELNAIGFAWAGATSPGIGHYYRIQGKTFLVEFDNTQNKANHIHSVWRDFDGDFGRDLIREHYENDHHH